MSCHRHLRRRRADRGERHRDGPEDAAATAIDVLANDTDPDGGPKSIDAVTQPANGDGRDHRRRDGSDLRAGPDYCNTQAGGSPDTFTYTLNGGSTATVVGDRHLRRRPADGGQRHRDRAGGRGRECGRRARATTPTPTAGRRRSRRRPSRPNGTVVITGGGHRADLPAERQLLQHPAGRLAGHVHVHAQRRVDRDRVRHRHLRQRRRPSRTTRLVANESADGNGEGRERPRTRRPDPAYPQTTISGDILAGVTDVDGPGPLHGNARHVRTTTAAQSRSGRRRLHLHPAASTSGTDTSDLRLHRHGQRLANERNASGQRHDRDRGLRLVREQHAAGNSVNVARAVREAGAGRRLGADHTAVRFAGDSTTTGRARQLRDDRGPAADRQSTTALQVDPTAASPAADTLLPAEPGTAPDAHGDDRRRDRSHRRQRGSRPQHRSADRRRHRRRRLRHRRRHDRRRQTVVDTVDAASTQAGLEPTGTGTFNVANLAANTASRSAGRGCFSPTPARRLRARTTITQPRAAACRQPAPT